MLVVSGTNNGSAVVTGGGTLVWSYDPRADVWTRLVTTNDPPGRTSATSVWTGTKLIQFGGRKYIGGCSPFCWYYEGYTFDPATNAWTQNTDAPIVGGLYIARFGHASVWTGTNMLTYAGNFPSIVFNVAGAYNLGTNSWSVPPAGPDARSYVSGTMFGTKAYFWGGANAVDYTDAGAMGFVDGVIFDNVTQTWSRWSQLSPLVPRAAAAMASSPTQIIVWGGRLGANSYNDGAVFEPGTNTWKSLPTANAPAARACAASVWTGEEFIVWGGLVNGVPQQSGGILR